MKKSYVLALLFLGVASALVAYDRYATSKGDADTSSDRTLLVPDLAEVNVSRFIFSLAQPQNAADEADALDEVDEDETSSAAQAAGKSAAAYSLVIEAMQNSAPATADGTAATPLQWSLASPIEFPAKAETISQLMSAFLTYRYDEVFAAANYKLPQFGIFPDTSTRLQVWTDASEPKFQKFSYLVGADAPVGFKMYIATSFHPGHVYFGPRSSVINQQRTLTDFMDMSLPTLSFGSGDTLQLTSFRAADDGGGSVVFFEESFTKSEDAPAVADGMSDNEGSEDSEDADSSLTAEAVPAITLAKFPEKNELVSAQVLDDLLALLGGISATKLAYDVGDTARKAAIADAPDKLTIVLGAKAAVAAADASTVSMELTQYEQGYYIKKHGEYLELSQSGDDLGDYFTKDIQDFLIHPLPLGLAQTALKTIELTSHQHEETDPGYKKDYQLTTSGQWLSTSGSSSDDSGSQSEVATAAGSEDSEEGVGSVGVGSVDNVDETSALDDLEDLDLDKPDELSANITEFVTELYQSHYHKKTAKQPDAGFTMAYSVELGSASMTDRWEIFTSGGYSDELWLKHVSPAGGEPVYYFLKSALLDDIKEPYFDTEGTQPASGDDELPPADAAAADGAPASFNESKAVNLKANLTPQLSLEAPDADTSGDANAENTNVENTETE